MRVQNIAGKPEINIVFEVSNYLVDLEYAAPLVATNPEMRNIVKACLKSLIDFVTGPC
jgi:hypothetical protein